VKRGALAESFVPERLEVRLQREGLPRLQEAEERRLVEARAETVAGC
jgi:hypothetical protein